ncbi:vWA domain-containing protein [Metabacillus sp. RGM 3146]|uniref:vWA domain-containing protein n=1 Tax=Metabacillus sp. RGM 3146 TaxID=3401092 RepID=UPI003B9B6A33
MNKDLTEIVFLIDRSGSMAGLESDTIGGFNALISRQSQFQGETKVTAILFDDQYEMLWSAEKAENVTLTTNEYYVRGCTALLDAIGKTILDVGSRLMHTSEEQRPGKMIFVITTDGMENASREFTYKKVKEVIIHQQEKYNWEFLFLGANMDAFQEADQLGIHKDMAYEFTATSAGVEQMYSALDSTLMEMRIEEDQHDE